jgi:hypothetical protein
MLVVACVGLAGNIDTRRAEMAIDQGRYDEAISAARSSRRWMPWSYRPYALEAEALMGAGRPDDAAVALVSALEHGGSRRWELWLQRAKFARDSTTRRGAIERARQLNPKSVEIAAYCAQDRRC